MPGPMGLICTCTPLPWHVSQVCLFPLLLPVPLHFVQGSLRDSDNFLQCSMKHTCGTSGDSVEVRCKADNAVHKGDSGRISTTAVDSMQHQRGAAGHCWMTGKRIATCCSHRTVLGNAIVQLLQ